MRWRLVVIWLLGVTSAAPDELPSPSDVLGSYLPPSNSYESSVPKDSFQHLNLGLPSSPGRVFPHGSSPSGSKESNEYDSTEGGRYDFSNFNFNIPKNGYTEPKEKLHSSSSEETSSVGKDYVVVQSTGKLPEESVRQPKAKHAFTISQHASQRGDIVPDENGMVCISADLYYELISQADNKIPCAPSGKRKETVEIKPTIESSKPKQTYFSSKIAGESRVTQKQPKKSVTPDQVGYELPKPSYESPTHLTTVSKPTSASTKKETEFDLEESDEKRDGHFFGRQPQVPSFFSVSTKDASKPDLGYSTPSTPKKPKPSYSSTDHSKGGTGKALYRPTLVQSRRKPYLKGLHESSEESYTESSHPSGQVEPKKTTHTSGDFYQSAKSISGGDGRDIKPDSHFGIGLTPSLKSKTSEYKTPGSCCQVVKNGESHPDSVFSLVTKSKPFSVHGDSTLKGESEDSLSTSLFFKTPETKHTLSGSRTNIHANEGDTGAGSFTPIKDVHQINKVSKETPYFTNNISQQKVELFKSPHFTQAKNDDRSDEDNKPSVEHTYQFPGQISTIPSQVQKIKPKISPPRNVDIFGSSLKSKEKSHDSGKIFGTAVKSEVHGKPKPTISVSSSKHDSDEETFQKTLKQPAHGYKSVKEQPHGETKFPTTLTSTAKISKSIYKPSTLATGRTYIAPKSSSQSLSEDNLPGFKGSQTYGKTTPDTFSSKEIPNIFKSPSIAFGKSEHTKEILPQVTKDKKVYSAEQAFSTHSSDSSEEAKGQHAATKIHRGGSYHAPSSSSTLPKVSGSQSEDSVGSSHFFKTPTASHGSSPQQHSAVSFQSTHKQTPTRNLGKGAKYKIPSAGGEASRHPGRFSGTFTKATQLPDKGDDATGFVGNNKVPSQGGQPNRGLGQFSGAFSKTPQTSNEDKERKPGLDGSYKTPSHRSQPVGLGGTLSKTTRTSGKVHEKRPGLGGNYKEPSQGSQPGVFTSPFTKTIQASVKDDDKRPTSSRDFKTSTHGSQPGRFVSPFSKKTSISDEDNDKIPRLGGSYKAPLQGIAPGGVASIFPQTTQTSDEEDGEKTSFEGRYNAPSQGSKPAKQPGTVAGSFFKKNKESNEDDDKPVGLLGNLKDSTLGSQPGRFASTFSKTADTSDEDDDEIPSFGGRYKAPSQGSVPISQPRRVTTTFPKSTLTSESDEDKTTGFGDKYRGSTQGQPRGKPEHFAGTFSKTTDTTKGDRSKDKDAGRTYPTTSTISVVNPVSLSSDQSKGSLSSSTPKHKSTKVQEKIKPSQTHRFRGRQPSTSSKPQSNQPSQKYQSPKAFGSLYLSGQQQRTHSDGQPVGQHTQSRNHDRPSVTHRDIGKTEVIASAPKTSGGTYSSTSKASPSNQSQKSTSVDPQAGSTDSSGQKASKMKMMMPYDFEWRVNDADTNNDFGQKASSDGMVEKGEYHVVLPDGRKQVVTYLADWETGYHVNVKYEDTKIAPKQS